MMAAHLVSWLVGNWAHCWAAMTVSKKAERKALLWVVCLAGSWVFLTAGQKASTWAVHWATTKVDLTAANSVHWKVGSTVGRTAAKTVWN